MIVKLLSLVPSCSGGRGGVAFFHGRDKIPDRPAQANKDLFQLPVSDTWNPS